MQTLEGLDDRTLALDGENLQIGGLITNIWVPLERQAEVEAFGAAVDAAREASS